MTKSAGASLRAFPPLASVVPSSFVTRPSSFSSWHLPHLLGLDAPCVAVAWQLWWSRALSVELRWFHYLVLALAVWLIYLADRLADAAALRPAEEDGAVGARHRFAWRHQRGLACLLPGIVAALAVLTLCWLTWREFCAGCGLLAVQAVYFGCIHLRGTVRPSGHTAQASSLRSAGWKEAWVGVSFALGTAWFSLLPADGKIPVAVCSALAVWSVVCFLNCALISHWERDPRASRSGLRLGAACASITSFGALSTPWLGPAIWPVALAAAGLWWVDRCWSHCALSRETARVLADVVLLAPLPLLILC